MATDAATRAVLLEVLNRHLNTEPHERGQITINNVKYEIVSSVLDFLVKDTASRLLAARLILAVREVPGPDGAREQPAVELEAHIFTTTNSDQEASSSTLVILDAVPQAHGGSPPAPPHRASTIPTHPLPESSSKNNTINRRPLAETYRSYIPAFMTPDSHTATTSLSYFLHQPVTHNTRPLAIPEYHHLGGAAREAIPDIACEIVGLVADEERQVVAARLEFKGTLMRPFGGWLPGEGGEGRAIRIEEVVFYWFDGRRIREVVSLVDLGGLGGGLEEGGGRPPEQPPPPNTHTQDQEEGGLAVR